MGMIYRRKYKDAKTGKIKTLKTLWLKYYVDGKPIRVSSGKESVREAKLELAKLEAGKKARKSGSFLYEQLMIDFINDQMQNNRKSTKVLAQRMDRHIHPYFAHLDVTQITPTVIIQYIAKRQSEGAKNATINRELAAIRRSFSLALERGIIETMPRIKKLKEPPARQGFLERNEVAQIVRAVPYRVVRSIVLFAFYTGWRKSEILGLKWDNISFHSGEIRLYDSKSGEPRVIYMTFQLRRLLKLRKQTGHDYVFTWQNGDPVKDFRETWSNAVEKAKLPGRLFHDLRRSAVRNFMTRGLSIHVSMKITGHKTQSIFDRYRIVSGTELKEAAKLLSGHNRGAQRPKKKAKKK